jgi:rhodanese-related sulfurtransferase
MAVSQISPVDCAPSLKSFFIIDVRSKAERASDLGFLPPSHHYELPVVLADGWNPPVDVDAPILCVCRSGVRSLRAAHALVSRGYRFVHNLTGGMLAWQAADLPRAVISPSPDGATQLTFRDVRDGVLACFVDSMASAPSPISAPDAEIIFRAALREQWDEPTSDALHEALASLAAMASEHGVPLDTQARNMATFSSMLAWIGTQ